MPFSEVGWSSLIPAVQNVPCFSGTAAVHGKQPRFPAKGTGAVFALLHVTIQEGRDLCTGAGGVGVEASAAHAGGDAVLHGPGHRLCVVSVSGNVGKVRRTARCRLAHGAPQHGDHLRAVDGAVGVRAVGNALGFRPILGLFVPDAAAGQVRVVLAGEDRPQLGAGGGGVGRVDRGAHAVHQPTGTDEVDGVLGPVLLRVDEALGVIHDLHGRAAVDRQLDAVRRGQGVLDDLLGAVRVDKNRHRAGFHVGNGNFHLGFPRALGQFHLDGGGSVGIAAGLDLNGGLDRLARLFRVLDRLGADLGVRLGLAVLVGLDGAGGAVSGLGLGDGTAVGVGGGLDGGAVLLGLSLDLGAVGLGLGLNLGAVGPGGGAGAGGGLAGTAGTAATTTAGAAGAAAGRTAGRAAAAAGAGLRRGLKFQFQLPAHAADAFRIQCQISTLMRHGRQVLFC